MSTPVLFLRPRSRTYDRDCEFARRVWNGDVPRNAAEAMQSEGYNITPMAGKKLQQRLRERARLWAGAEVSDAMILRLMFDRARAEAEYKEIRHKLDNGRRTD